MSTTSPHSGPAEADRAALDAAILLYRRGNYRDARASLQALLARNPANITAWNALGYLNRDIGETAAAAAAFDRALALRSDDPTAVKGRARMAFEQAERDFRDRYAAAFAQSPGDPRLMMEFTEARLAEGDEAAVGDFARFVRQYPDWTEGQIALARMLWETPRDEGFADHIRRLLAQQPRRLDCERSSSSCCPAAAAMKKRRMRPAMPAHGPDRTASLR